MATQVPSDSLTINQPLTCLQSSTNRIKSSIDIIIQKPNLHEFMDGLLKRKYSDNFSHRDYSCETSLNGSSYYAMRVEMETNACRNDAPFVIVS